MSERRPRGKYIRKQGLWLHGEANGAFNIIRKVATQLDLDLTKVGRGLQFP